MTSRDYTQRKRARTTAKTREKIIQAAGVVYVRDGFDSSIASIAREAGVAAGTVHHHFDSPAALRAAFAEDFIDFELTGPEAIEAIGNRSERLRAVIGELYRIFDQTAPLYQSLRRLTEPFPELEQWEQVFYARMTHNLTTALGPVAPEQMRVVFAIASPGTAGALRMVGMDVDEAVETGATLIERYLEAR